MTYEEYVNLFYPEVEGRVDTIAELSALYKAAYNEAIDDVEKSYKKLGFKMTDLKGLKK